MPVTKSTEKEKAHYLYFNTAKTQKEIANMLDVTEKTMSGWVTGGNWAELKKATYYSPDQETHFLYEELREIDNNIRKRPEGERFGTKLELEAKAKILSLITGPLKNTGDKWRNIIHEYAIEESQPNDQLDNHVGYHKGINDKFGNPIPRNRGFDIIIEGIDPRDVPDL